MTLFSAEEVVKISYTSFGEYVRILRIKNHEVM